MKLKQEDIDNIRRVRELLINNHRYRISINELSRETGINRNKLQYGFKYLFGVSIDDYRIQLRLEKARELLERTDKSVKEISILVGYKSFGSFSTAFKKMFQKSPSQWRSDSQQ